MSRKKSVSRKLSLTITTNSKIWKPFWSNFFYHCPSACHRYRRRLALCFRFRTMGQCMCLHVRARNFILDLERDKFTKLWLTVCSWSKDEQQAGGQNTKSSSYYAIKLFNRSTGALYVLFGIVTMCGGVLAVSDRDPESQTTSKTNCCHICSIGWGQLWPPPDVRSAT